MWLLAVALVGADRRAPQRRRLVLALAVLVVVAAAASTVHILGVCHSGAESVWG